MPKTILVPIVIGAALAGLTSPGSAQLKARVMRVLPGQAVIVKPLPKQPPAIRTFEMQRVPADWFHLEDSTWTLKRHRDVGPNAIAPEPRGVYVEMTRVAPPGKNCNEFDVWGRIDLTQLRANGFRLVSFQETRLPIPNGYVAERLYAPRRPVDLNAPITDATTNVVVGDNAMIPTVSQQLGLRFPRVCWIGYSVYLTIRGPEGIDPATGREIRPSRPPN